MHWFKAAYIALLKFSGAWKFIEIEKDTIILLSYQINEAFWSRGRALECNLTGRVSFFKNLYNSFRKKIACRYPVLELLDYKKFQKTIGEQ